MLHEPKSKIKALNYFENGGVLGKAIRLSDQKKNTDPFNQLPKRSGNFG